ncbi:hypothetical protein GCM10009601_07330 [Streptomyces thermospinosisporus]|uniref:Uncharacterized protein n=1 Tax=Streptomyces thermospinosisporus TaxID=161482 RepID=A0ABN1YJY9_9ACTN
MAPTLQVRRARRKPEGARTAGRVRIRPGGPAGHGPSDPGAHRATGQVGAGQEGAEGPRRDIVAPITFRSPSGRHTDRSAS